MAERLRIHVVAFLAAVLLALLAAAPGASADTGEALSVEAYSYDVPSSTCDYSGAVAPVLALAGTYAASSGVAEVDRVSGCIYDSSSNSVATNALDDVLPKPVVSDPKLQNIVDDLYKGTTNPNRVGFGTTADAVRCEAQTGLPVGGRFHTMKAEQYSNALRNVLKGDLSASDRLVAQSLLDDLLSALGGGS